ncbi:helix-turn-helix transcriptional regulator [Hespellia stercorisuis]|uniref:HTH araC/xylS-type domain-containing protein n=1 Tax=Hespellia stercorisuis DSM 15480 TaxID=1121950 RepID=A0A1M6T4F2_9FIRM|nr:hypothetical protein [Hespellia stercorisuis]SHK51766.1 hypothetical protein SAMN02745243_03121 [Hespellia stercorisuis DSM 15480]
MEECCGCGDYTLYMCKKKMQKDFQLCRHHAANLLKYLEETISNIAEYINFPSQSYMEKVFKEKDQMTSKKYCEQNSSTEYFTVKQ